MPVYALMNAEVNNFDTGNNYKDYGVYNIVNGNIIADCLIKNVKRKQIRFHIKRVICTVI